MSLLILIADDDPGIRLALSNYLQLSGYSVISARDGQQALSLLAEYHPHLLISDIKMPKKDGYQLVEEVRKLPQHRLLPVVFLTERASTPERVKGYQVGCDIYLAKPIDLEELGAVIRSLLERSQIIQSELRFFNGDAQKVVIDTPKNNNQYQLTQREKQVLELLSTGLSNIDIGKQLHLSPRTIEKYVSSLLKKTNTHNRAELVRFSLEHQL